MSDDREVVLGMISDKDLKEAARNALDEGWQAQRHGKSRIKFTHPDADDSVFCPLHVGSAHTVKNFESRLDRALRPHPVMESIKAVREDPERAEAEEPGITELANKAETVEWKLLPVHSQHAHYENITSRAKLVSHVDGKHAFRKHFGFHLDKRIELDSLEQIHDWLHDGQAIQQPPEPPQEPKSEDAVPHDEEPETADSAPDSASRNGSSTSGPSPDEDDREEREMGEVIQMREDDDSDDARHYGSLQRAVLSVLHEFPGVALTVEEVIDLCADELEQGQASGALWRCSRIGGLRVSRIGRGIYRYDPPDGAPTLPVTSRERAPVATPPARPRPAHADAERVSAPPPSPPVADRPPVAPSERTAPAPDHTSPRDDILFEVVLRAEDGSLVLRASDGTVWQARKI